MSITRHLWLKGSLAGPDEALLENDPFGDPDDLLVVLFGVVAAERQHPTAGQLDLQLGGGAAAVAPLGQLVDRGDLGRQQGRHIALLAQWRCAAVLTGGRSALHPTVLALLR